MTDLPDVHVVDDDEAVRRSLAYLLRTAGHVVYTWASGEAFLAGMTAGPACIYDPKIWVSRAGAPLHAVDRAPAAVSCPRRGC